jgi:hypothetical protein
MELNSAELIDFRGTGGHPFRGAEAAGAPYSGTVELSRRAVSA